MDLVMENTITRDTVMLEMKYKGIVAGIDEVGRGCLAGPVVAAAVVLPNDFPHQYLDDSKRLTKKQRAFVEKALYGFNGVKIGLGVVDNTYIDTYNIRLATLLAMKWAVYDLPVRPARLLIDGLDRIDTTIKQTPVVHGESKSWSIAAASIVAKECRDRLMNHYGSKYPDYAFEQNKGYGTKVHIQGLEEVGPCEIHRMTFKPVKKTIMKIIE